MEILSVDLTMFDESKHFDNERFLEHY